MTVRSVEGKKIYQGGTAIEITEDKVINLLLRVANNLLKVNEDNELYCDLQLNDELRPTDDFPVGVTTGRVVEDNGWDRAGTILCAKTTSGDNIKLVYTDDGEIRVDNGTGTFKQMYLASDVDELLAGKQDVLTAGTGIDITNDVISVDNTVAMASDVNTKTFYLSGTTGATALAEAQEIYDWYMSGKNPLVMFTDPHYHDTCVFTLQGTWSAYGDHIIDFFCSTSGGIDNSYSYRQIPEIQLEADENTNVVHSIFYQNVRRHALLDPTMIYTTPFIPTDDGHPTTKKYVDDRDTYIGTSAPTSNLVEGRTWYDTTNDVLKVYDGTNWNSVGTSSSDLNTKTFYLSSTSDLTTAQSAYDWYLAGKNPIICYDNKIFLFYGSNTSGIIFRENSVIWYRDDTYGASKLQIPIICFDVTSQSVTNVYLTNSNINNWFIEANYNYTTPYTPTNNSSPATKKYVDDNDTVISGDAGVTYIIKKSTTPPPAGTPSNVLTFVG